MSPSPHPRRPAHARAGALLPALLPAFGLAHGRAAGAQTAPAAGAAHVAHVGQDAPGRVEGVVFDSLLGRPLAGAAVWVHGSGRMVLVGGDGRFAFDGVAPGPRALGASHPALDSLGLPALAATITVPAGATAHVALATPARPRLAAGLCGAGAAGPAAAGGRPGVLHGALHGVLHGVVADARQGAPARARLAGAVVTVRYVLEARSGRALPKVVDAGARTDAAGTYAVCGLPAAGELVVRAGAGSAGSGPAYVTLGERGVARLDLAVDPGAAPAQAAAPAAAGGDAPAGRVGAALAGVVRDTAGVPRPGARVRVADRPDLEVRTDSLGRFALAGLARGTQTLVVSAIGYTPQPWTVDVRGAPADTAQVVLRRVVQLARVTARGRFDRAAAVRDGIARRKRLSMGYVVDSATIDRMGSLRSAFTTVPYLRVSGSPAQWGLAIPSPPRSITRPSAYCAPDVWLDNFPTDAAVLNDLPASHVIAIEVYRRPAQAPIQYVMGTRNICGVVLVWTRSAR